MYKLFANLASSFLPFSAFFLLFQRQRAWRYFIRSAVYRMTKQYLENSKHVPKNGIIKRIFWLAPIFCEINVFPPRKLWLFIIYGSPFLRSSNKELRSFKMASSLYKYVYKFRLISYTLHSIILRRTAKK